MIKKSGLPKAFREVVDRIVEREKAQTHDWRLEEKGGQVVLLIPKLSSEGFDVTVVADNAEVTVCSEYVAHQHFTSDGDHAAVSEQAMGLVRDLLSPMMRVRVIEIGGKASRGDFQVWRNGEWRTESVTGIIRFPFLRKRVEKFYVNRRLPIRIEPKSARRED